MPMKPIAAPAAFLGAISMANNPPKTANKPLSVNPYTKKADVNNNTLPDGLKNITNNANISITPKINVTGGLLAENNLSEIYPNATHPIIPAKVFRLRIAPLSIRE